MRNLYIISINHQTHSAEERIKLDLDESGWAELFAYLKYNLNLDGYVFLRTCNRLELYYEADENLTEEIIEKWRYLIPECSLNCAEKIQSMSGYLESIEHLLQLSAGFKSAIYGDDQIHSQLKKAFEEARSNKTLSTLLERSYQAIMRFHKQICRHTDFKSQTISLAYQALKSARFRFGTENLKSKNVLIIGAGDMAAQVVKYLPKFKFGSVSITNRTKTKAEKLVSGTPITVIPYTELKFENYDIIISCTDQGYSLISEWAGIEYYIDLSLPSAHLTEVPSSHILLKDLQELINQRNNVRMQSVEKVRSILNDMALEFESWCKGWIVASFKVNILHSRFLPL